MLQPALPAMAAMPAPPGLSPPTASPVASAVPPSVSQPPGDGPGLTGGERAAWPEADEATKGLAEGADKGAAARVAERAVERMAEPAELRGALWPEATAASADARQTAEFLAVLERQLAQCRRYGQPLAVLAVGIERVAALPGPHVAGVPGAPGASDLTAAVSHELWNRLRARTRAKDTVLRLSDREFGVLLPGCRPQAAAGAGRRLGIALGGVYAIGPGPVWTAVGVGLANLGADGDTAAALWQAAVQSRTEAPGSVAESATRRHDRATPEEPAGPVR